jgi:hypothetical protein
MRIRPTGLHRQEPGRVDARTHFEVFKDRSNGIRVSLKTQAPLRRPGTLSTTGHCNQSRLDVAMTCDPFAQALHRADPGRSYRGGWQCREATRNVIFRHRGPYPAALLTRPGIGNPKIEPFGASIAQAARQSRL